MAYKTKTIQEQKHFHQNKQGMTHVYSGGGLNRKEDMPKWAQRTLDANLNATVGIWGTIRLGEILALLRRCFIVPSSRWARHSSIMKPKVAILLSFAIHHHYHLSFCPTSPRC